MITTQDLSVIKNNLMQKETSQLLDIISFNQDDYKPEVVILIKEILLERSVSQSDINQADCKFQDILVKTNSNQKTQNRVPKTNRFLIWLMIIASLGMLNYIIKLVQSAVLNNITK